MARLLLVRPGGRAPVLLDCGATSLSALKSLGLDPGEIGAVFVSHLHGDHFGGLPFLILDGQFTRRTSPLTVAGPPGTGTRLRQAMEVVFPGSASTDRRFALDVVELTPGGTTAVAGIEVTCWEVRHPSGAPPLALRLGVGGKTIAYTGDTAWTDVLVSAAAAADLLIAEAYYYDKAIPHHLRYADLAGPCADTEPPRTETQFAIGCSRWAASIALPGHDNLRTLGLDVHPPPAPPEAQSAVPPTTGSLTSEASPLSNCLGETSASRRDLR